MSLRIAVALAATIGAGILMSTAAEARPNVVGFRGDYSPGTIVVKTNERRSASAAPASSGRAPPASTANTRTRHGRRRAKSSATNPTCRT